MTRLAPDAVSWWFGLITGIAIGLAIAYRNRIIIFVAQLLERDDDLPVWPAPPPAAGQAGGTHLRLIWTATPKPAPYDHARETGGVA